MKPAFLLELSDDGAAILYTALTVMGNQCLSQPLWAELDSKVPDELKESFCILPNPITQDPEVARV